MHGVSETVKRPRGISHVVAGLHGCPPVFESQHGTAAVADGRHGVLEPVEREPDPAKIAQQLRHDLISQGVAVPGALVPENVSTPMTSRWFSQVLCSAVKPSCTKSTGLRGTECP
jgi:hypothetical protein